MAIPFEGDEGTAIKLNLQVDITDATDQKMYYTRPDGTTGEFTAGSGVTVTETTKLQYITQAGDIPLGSVGTWHLQGWYQNSSGSWATTWAIMEVGRKMA
jgi:hypothetical protein